MDGNSICSRQTVICVREKWIEVDDQGRAGKRSGWSKGWCLDLTVFSTLNTVCDIIFELSFCFSSFSPSDVRCLKGKDNLGGEDVRQTERSMAKCTYRNPVLGLFPAFCDFETHGTQQASVVCKAVGETLPRHCYLLWKQHACLHILHEAQGFFCFPFSLKMKWTFNGMGWGTPHTSMTLVQGQRCSRPWLWEEFVIPSFIW